MNEAETESISDANNSDSNVNGNTDGNTNSNIDGNTNVDVSSLSSADKAMLNLLRSFYLFKKATIDFIGEM